MIESIIMDKNTTKNDTASIAKSYDEMPYEDMSRILETSEGALKASYHHAVKKIEKYFDEVE